MEVGEVGQVPPANTPKGEWDWDGMAFKAKASAPASVLAAKNVPETRIKSVRLYSRDPFVTAEGHIAVSQRGTYVGEDGRRHAEEVWMTWVPREEK